MESKVRLIIDRCKGCGICVDACPHDLLQFSGKHNKKGYEYVVLTDNDACTSCTQCAVMCPEIALHIFA